MLEASAKRIASLVGPDELLLDVGGWATPFPRADWVLDLLPYETRGRHPATLGPAEERFSAETWVTRDICDRDPWPFADGHFDFAICSHTLEDVRDPVWVCAELTRVAKAGYVETPSRLAEQSLGVAGPFVGWSHHRWLVDYAAGMLRFTMKPHAIHANPALHLSLRQGEMLSAEERVLALFWEEELPACEEIYTVPGKLDAYLADLVARHRAELSARIPPDPPFWRRLAWQVRHRRLRPPHGSWRSSA